MNTNVVGEYIKQRSIKYHCYLNDTQVYVTLKLCDKWDDLYFDEYEHAEIK